MKQTGMALAGASKAQITDAIRTAVAKKELGAPESGSMAYMMSKEAYLTDRGGHNLAHLMFELPRNSVLRDACHGKPGNDQQGAHLHPRLLHKRPKIKRIYLTAKRAPSAGTGVFCFLSGVKGLCRKGKAFNAGTVGFCLQ